jgi:DNA-directed RNA polymerase specialized sigma24 family protein
LPSRVIIFVGLRAAIAGGAQRTNPRAAAAGVSGQNQPDLERIGMEGLSVSKSEWTLSAEALARFLASLDPDADRAGEKYESLRLTLMKFFDWRGAHFPEDLADETINRVIRKIDEGETIRDVPTYCHGVARLVLLEKLKGPESRRADFEELPPTALAAPDPKENDERQDCFERCLKELPVESLQLILQYYGEEKREKINRRLAMAERLGIPLNALRSRAQRIRNRLEECVNGCVKKK